jgi:hypothetical protein
VPVETQILVTKAASPTTNAITNASRMKPLPGPQAMQRRQWAAAHVASSFEVRWDERRNLRPSIADEIASFDHGVIPPSIHSLSFRTSASDHDRSQGIVPPRTRSRIIDAFAWTSG